jgi:hypothetical protein
MSTFRRIYGAGPLHLLAALATLAVAAYALVRVAEVVADPGRVVLWLTGAIVAHDLVLFPVYAALGVLVAAALVPRARPPSRLTLAALNHFRFAALSAGLLGLVWFPLVAAKAPGTYMRATGLDVDVYRDRWLIASAVLIGASALLLVLRAVPKS